MTPAEKWETVQRLVGGDITTHDLNDLSVYNFNDGQTPPTEEEINTELARMQTEHDSQEYARNRKAEYDALNQFEMQFDDKENGTTTWEDAIAAIKTKYPKG